jgi:RNA polymerase sigma-70 factor (ECF subfamily)
VVALNRAVAHAMVDGPEVGLRMTDTLSHDLDGYHLYHAARADLLRRLDQREEAAAAYRRALDMVENAVERRYLEGRLAEVSGSGPPDAGT